MLSLLTNWVVWIVYIIIVLIGNKTANTLKRAVFMLSNISIIVVWNNLPEEVAVAPTV